MKIPRKILVVGDMGVGKSTFVLSGIVEKFAFEIKGVIGGAVIFDDYGRQLTPIHGGAGSPFWTKWIDVGENQVEMYFYELPGGKYGPLVLKSWIKGTHLIMLCYNQNSEESFLNLESWMALIKKNSSPHPKIVLIGLKGDLKNMISGQTIEKFCQKYHIDNYFKVSSKKMENVLESIDIIAKFLLI